MLFPFCLKRARMFVHMMLVVKHLWTGRFSPYRDINRALPAQPTRATGNSTKTELATLRPLSLCSRQPRTIRLALASGKPDFLYGYPKRGQIRFRFTFNASAGREASAQKRLEIFAELYRGVPTKVYSLPPDTSHLRRQGRRPVTVPLQSTKNGTHTGRWDTLTLHHVA